MCNADKGGGGMFFERCAARSRALPDFHLLGMRKGEPVERDLELLETDIRL